MADVPHFDLPFRYRNGQAVVVEQDTVDDIAACVQAALLTRPGWREDAPDFGVPDPTFTQQPLDTEAIVAAVERSEPRASLLAEDDPDRLDDTVRRVRLSLSTEE